MASSQDAVVEFLKTGAAYGDPAATVTCYETHAAFVFVVGPLAYKMKREVHYSFLDFSTIDRRHEALRAELALNRRTAPELYRRVLAVTEAPGGLMLDGDGPVIEWLLEMTRFEQAALLSNMAVAGALDDGLMGALAPAIAALHEVADVNRAAGGFDAMAAVIDGNWDDLTGNAAVRRLQPIVGKVKARTIRELEKQRGLLDARRRDGFVRHCHGDLHLGNIVMIDGAPVLFDCLEFDVDLATIDTFYDLAFVLMDLCERRLPAAANRLLNGYLEATTDYQGTALLGLFMAVRATIRAKIEGFTASICTDHAESRHLRDCRRYLKLAKRLLKPAAARLVAIGGVSGTGKSTVARALAPDLGALPGAAVLRSDLVRKGLFGVAATARLPETAYADDVTEQVYDTLAQRAGGLLAAGRPVIVDATCLDAGFRERLRGIAWQHGVAFDGIWLTGPADVLAARIAERRDDPSDATVEVLQRQLASPAVTDWIEIDASGAVRDVVGAVRALVSGSQSSK